jgi:hypothetical protein
MNDVVVKLCLCNLGIAKQNNIQPPFFYFKCKKDVGDK